MKKTVSICSFIASTLLFLYFLVISVSFIAAFIGWPPLETNGDVFGAMITIYAYAAAFLIVSVFGLLLAIISKMFSNSKFVKISSNVEIVFFLVGIIFSIFQLFIKYANCNSNLK